MARLIDMVVKGEDKVQAEERAHQIQTINAVND